MQAQNLQEEFILWRKRLGLNQKEAAGRFGVAVSTISNWERAKSEMNETARKLFETFKAEKP